MNTPNPNNWTDRLRHRVAVLTQPERSAGLGSILLMASTAGMRLASGGFSLKNALFSASVLIWDTGVTCLVHSLGDRSARSRAEMSIYEGRTQEIEAAQTRRSEVREMKIQRETELDSVLRERAFRIDRDFDRAEMSAYSTSLIVNRYMYSVVLQRSTGFQSNN